MEFEPKINFECDFCHSNEVGSPLLGHLKTWGSVMPVLVSHNGKAVGKFICEKCFNSKYKKGEEK